MNHVNEVMFNVIHHTHQQLEEVLSCRTTKGKSLHEIPTVAVNCLQTSNALLRYSKAIEVNIRRSSTLKVGRVKIIGLGLFKTGNAGNSLTHMIGNGGKTATNLNQRGQSHLGRRWT